MFGVFVYDKLVRAFFTKKDANEYKTKTFGRHSGSLVRKCTEDELYEYDCFGNLGETNSARHDLV